MTHCECIKNLTLNYGFVSEKAADRYIQVGGKSIKSLSLILLIYFSLYDHREYECIRRNMSAINYLEKKMFTLH